MSIIPNESAPPAGAERSALWKDCQDATNQATALQGNSEEFDSDFPIECLPLPMRIVVEEVSRVTPARNLPLAAATAIGTISAACGAGIEIATGPNRTTRANLFILGVAESGTGKSENFRFVAQPLQEIQAAASEQFREAISGEIDTELDFVEERRKGALKQAARCDDPSERAMHKAELMEADARKKELEQRRNAEPTYVVRDITREALIDLFSKQNRESIASFSAEARGILGVIDGRYSSASDEDVYCASYSGDALSTHRVGRASVALKRPCLTVCWFVQPDAASKLLVNSSMTGSGLLPRFLLFNSNAEPLEDTGGIDPVPDRILSEWSRIVRDLVKRFCDSDSTREVPIIEPTPEAAEVIREYFNEAVRLRRSDGPHHDLAAYLARWAENAWKLALVFHVAKHGLRATENQLSIDTAKDAVRVMRWFNERQIDVLRGSQRDQLKKRHDRLREVLTDRGGESSARELEKSHGFKLEEIEQLAAKFDDVRVGRRQQHGGGRPSIRVRLRTSRQLNGFNH
ncbi:YfjI family protein [Haloferula sp. A504]|uniref:YfjI family protein n=1 Tax=Haloferula sp. A504 TaxID=3373601 RepID=UPI0031C67E54|nr:DUF3987 domain-containing protein [Verrucomicrobiaceae bacterium E54]